jgi:hypothetical protein
MAARRKQQAAEPREQGREVKLRVPEPIMKFIEERARADRRPINATIIKLLSDAPYWEHMTNLDELSRRYEAMLNTAEVSFARYSSEITQQVLSRKFIETWDMIEQGEWEIVDTALRAAFAAMRLARAEMRNQQTQERAATQDRTAKR